MFAIDETWLKAQPPSVSRSNPAVPLSASLADRERELIETASAASGGRVSGKSGDAAKLGIPRQTLQSKIRTMGSIGIDSGQPNYKLRFHSPVPHASAELAMKERYREVNS
jgi:DNA-binding NtrC family response regulator